MRSFDNQERRTVVAISVSIPESSKSPTEDIVVSLACMRIKNNSTGNSDGGSKGGDSGDAKDLGASLQVRLYLVLMFTTTVTWFLSW